ncbi:lumenal Hsp70 protein, partial [Kickxella alabastrina]
LKSKNIVSDKPEVKVVTQTNELGFFEVVKAEASFNVTNPGYSQYIEDLAAWEKESAAAEAEAEGKAESETESETQTQTNGEGAKQKSKSKSLRSRPTPHPEIITEVVQLDINVEYQDLAKLGDEAMRKSRSLLKRMDDDDKARFAHHDAINQLETLIYHLRDIVEDEDVVTVTTNDEREALSEAVSQAAEWLESSAESSGVGLIDSKVKALKEIEKPIVHRRTQAAKRPDHISSLRAIVAQAEGLVAIYRREYTADEIAPAADVLRELEDTLDSTTSWLDEMTSKQDALAAHVDPVLTTADMDSKAVAIELSLAKVVAKKIRKAKAQSTTVAADMNSDNDEGASEILEDDSDYIDEDSEHAAANNNGHDEL